MTLHAPKSVTSVFYPEEVGGCGVEHKAKKGERLSVTCGSCEPLIVAYSSGWGSTPAQATLTEAEEAELEEARGETHLMLASAGAELAHLVSERAAAATAAKKKS